MMMIITVTIAIKIYSPQHGKDLWERTKARVQKYNLYYLFSALYDHISEMFLIYDGHSVSSKKNRDSATGQYFTDLAWY